MSPDYRPSRARWHRERTPIFWWGTRPAYVHFILRELTSLTVAWTAVLVIAEVWAVSRGEETHRRFVALLRSGPALAINGLALGGLLFHSVTWLNLAPKALVLRFAGRRLPDAAIVAMHYAVWLAASALVVWILLGV